MNICIFSRPFHPAVGGLEQIAKTLAYEFSAQKCSVEVVTDTKNSHSSDELFPFKITRTSALWERYKAFRRADVILFMNFTFVGVPIAILARRPIVLSHHGIYPLTGSLKRRLINFSKRQLTHFFLNISVSHFVARNLPGKSIVVPNAFDNHLFHYTSAQRDKDFVFCGRLVSDKGADILLDAYKLVVNRYPKTTLTFIGDGPERVDLQEKSKAFDYIHFTGTLRGQQLVNKLKEHSCMVIPSLWEEPFGIVALEGIASCDTVISSNRGGLPEAVGDCGILVSPTVDALAQVMISVLNAREQGDVIPGQPNNVQRAVPLEKHAPKHVAQKYLDVCCEALK